MGHGSFWRVRDGCFVPSPFAVFQANRRETPALNAPGSLKEFYLSNLRLMPTNIVMVAPKRRCGAASPVQLECGLKVESTMPTKAQAQPPWAHLRLPPFPEVAIRVLQLTNNENVQLHQLSELISSDAAFASEVLTIANSLVYAPRFPATTILQAIAVMGANHLQGMCLTVGVRTYLGTARGGPDAGQPAPARQHHHQPRHHHVLGCQLRLRHARSLRLCRQLRYRHRAGGDHLWRGGDFRAGHRGRHRLAGRGLSVEQSSKLDRGRCARQRRQRYLCWYRQRHKR